MQSKRLAISFLSLLWVSKGIFFHLMDWGTDVNTAVQHAINGYWAFCVLTVVFVLVPYGFSVWRNVLWNRCHVYASLRQQRPGVAWSLVPLVPLLVMWQPLGPKWKTWWISARYGSTQADSEGPEMEELTPYTKEEVKADDAESIAPEELELWAADTRIYEAQLEALPQLAIQLASITDIWKSSSRKQVQWYQYITISVSLLSLLHAEWSWFNIKNYSIGYRLKVVVARAINIPSRLFGIALGHWSLLLVYPTVYGLVRYAITPRLAGIRRGYQYSANERAYSVLHTVPYALGDIANGAALTVGVMNVVVVGVVTAYATVTDAYGSSSECISWYTFGHSYFWRKIVRAVLTKYLITLF